MKIFLFFLILLILYLYFYKPRKEKFLEKIKNWVKIKENKNKNREFVLDVVCGTYIEKNNAISVTVKEKEYFFCSKNCLEKFLKTID